MEEVERWRGEKGERGRIYREELGLMLSHRIGLVVRGGGYSCLLSSGRRGGVCC